VNATAHFAPLGHGGALVIIMGLIRFWSKMRWNKDQFNWFWIYWRQTNGCRKISVTRMWPTGVHSSPFQSHTRGIGVR